ncbi:MAG: hypothetical protein IJT91_05160, partial [Clostridia bacterium]|nr:hypothetical protein [Clostridia bacterium]
YGSGGGIEAYDVTYTKTVKINVTLAQNEINAAEFDFNGNGYRSVTANNTTYVMPDVNATEDDVIGSKAVGGKTVYYPIVWSRENSNPANQATKAPVLCPIFDGVITITDYDENNNSIVYDGSTVSMADGHLRAVSDVTTGNSFLSWSNGGAPPADNPVTVGGKLYYKSITISGVDRNQTTYVCEYAYTDTAGSEYHYFVGYIFPKLTKGSSCVAEGTLITLADGTQKPIEELSDNDMLLAFDHESGEYVPTPVLAVFEHGYDEYEMVDLAFSDGSSVTVVEWHSFFDLDEMKYVEIDPQNYSEFIGHRFVKYDAASGENGFVTLVSGNAYESFSECWGTWGYSNLSCLTNGLLSIPSAVGTYNYFDYDEDLKYNEEGMREDIEEYGLFTYEDWAEYIPFEIYDAFNFKYFKVAIGKGLATMDTYLDHIRLFYDLSALKNEP